MRVSLINVLKVLTQQYLLVGGVSAGFRNHMQPANVCGPCASNDQAWMSLLGLPPNSRVNWHRSGSIHILRIQYTMRSIGTMMQRIHGNHYSVSSQRERRNFLCRTNFPRPRSEFRSRKATSQHLLTSPARIVVHKVHVRLPSLPIYEIQY